MRENEKWEIERRKEREQESKREKGGGGGGGGRGGGGVEGGGLAVEILDHLLEVGWGGESGQRE